jgi:hypothetical protein
MIFDSSYDNFSDDVLKKYILDGIMFLNGNTVCVQTERSGWALNTTISPERYKKLKREVIIDDLNESD